tara:strand:- start:576 stop:1385 length:810 start_codon:yes stop_codon:yes gene_type:complete
MAPLVAGARGNIGASEAVRNVTSYYGSLIDLIGLSQKIMLPPGGQVLEDDSLRALDDNTPLRLPFPVTVLEFLTDEGPIRPGALACNKVITVARERLLEDGEQALVLSVIPCYTHNGSWSPLPEIAIPLTHAIDRKNFLNGGVGIRMFGSQTAETHADDYRGEVSALLGVLNALACSNVRTSMLPQSKVRKAIKTAIPFDDYYVLTIDTHTGKGTGDSQKHAGRSPREHLRRGHIRRFESGVKVWVSACVVAAGSAGKITKEYALRRAA